MAANTHSRPAPQSIDFIQTRFVDASLFQSIEAPRPWDNPSTNNPHVNGPYRNGLNIGLGNSSSKEGLNKGAQSSNNGPYRNGPHISRNNSLDTSSYRKETNLTVNSHDSKMRRCTICDKLRIYPDQEDCIKICKSCYNNGGEPVTDIYRNSRGYRLCCGCNQYKIHKNIKTSITYCKDCETQGINSPCRRYKEMTGYRFCGRCHKLAIAGDASESIVDCFDCHRKKQLK